MGLRLQRAQAAEATASAAAAAPAAARADSPASRAGQRGGRLSYQAQRELAALPDRLQGLEAEKAQIEAQLAEGSLYRGEPQQLKAQLQRLEAVSSEIEAGYARWADLEASSQGAR